MRTLVSVLNKCEQVKHKNYFYADNYCRYCLYLTLEGLKLAAAIGTPKIVNASNHRPPRRRKNDPGLSSPHEYNTPSFKDEYSFTYVQKYNNNRNMYYASILGFYLQSH